MSEEKLLTFPVLKHILTSWFFSPGRSSGSPGLSSLLEGRLSWPATQTTQLTQSSFLSTFHLILDLFWFFCSTVHTFKQCSSWNCQPCLKVSQKCLSSFLRFVTSQQMNSQNKRVLTDLDGMGVSAAKTFSWSQTLWWAIEWVRLANMPIKWEWEYSCACCT